MQSESKVTEEQLLLALKWSLSRDTGISSQAIVSHMVYGTAEVNSHPCDASDLGRCMRLLALIPEWRRRMGEMARYGNGWARLVEAWNQLETLYTKEAGVGLSASDACRQVNKTMIRIEAGEPAADFRTDFSPH